MFGSSVLEVAIAIVFIYLLISLLCTTINEGIASFFNVRGKNLFDGIRNVLNDPDFNRLAQQVYSHGLVDAISQEAAKANKQNRMPSYIPSSLFSLTLLDILHSHGAAALLPDEATVIGEQAQAVAKVKTAQADYDAANRNLDLSEAEKQTRKDALTAAQATLNNAQKRLDLLDAHKRRDADVANLAAVEKPYGFMGTINANALLPKEVIANVGMLRSAASNFPNQLAAPLASFEKAVASLDEGHTKTSLQVMIDKAKRDVVLLKGAEAKAEHYVEALGANIEKWYDDSMERVGGWYKRWSKKIIVIWALLLVGMLNADTIMIARRLVKDTALRASLVTAAQEASKPSQSAPAPPPGSPAPDEKSELYSSSNPQVDAILKGANKLSLPIGWDQNSTLNSWPDSSKDPWAWPSKIVGLMLTVGAATLGAPFWFDVLSKFINIRGSGTPPKETKKSAPQPEKIKTTA